MRRFGRRSESAELAEDRFGPELSGALPSAQPTAEASPHASARDGDGTPGPRSAERPPASNLEAFADNLIMESAPEPVAEDPVSPIRRSPTGRRPGGASSGQSDAATASIARHRIDEARVAVRPLLLEFMDVARVARLSTTELADEIAAIVPEICGTHHIRLNAAEQRELVQLLINELIGLGPIEPLLADETISEIMINGPDHIFVERNGLIEKTDLKYESAASLMNAATRIVSRIGRRVDESSPICDARLADGSRVNVIIPPLALRGPTITIRKFKRDKLTLEKLVEFGTISPEGAELLKIISASRCNIVISGGTGSGKTTLLNTLTRFIDNRERVITCEDAAELQLQQPHWVPLETRPANIEGSGMVNMRDLVKNCLRMRPERIIVGEVRGPEAFDLLQAMNTGHDGSMGTLHANTPREALSRLENMIAMANLNIPVKAIREQIASAVQVIIQIQRLRDGSRRITHITEIVGLLGDDVVTMQDLLTYQTEGEDHKGKIKGRHVLSGLRPGFWDKARYFGLEPQLAKVMNVPTNADGKGVSR